MTDSPNVELVRSICRAWERGDYSSADWAHPDLEYVYADGPAPGRWTQASEGFRDFLGAWEDFRVEAEEVRELDDERVLALTRFRGRGKGSGVVRFVMYLDGDRALADLGVASEDDTS